MDRVASFWRNKRHPDVGARARPNAHVQLQGTAVVGLDYLILQYLTLVHNLMQSAPVCCNM